MESTNVIKARCEMNIVDVEGLKERLLRADYKELSTLLIWMVGYHEMALKAPENKSEHDNGVAFFETLQIVCDKYIESKETE